MSGMRGFVYLNKRPQSAEEWGDIACKTLDIVIRVSLGIALLCGVVLAILCALT